MLKKYLKCYTYLISLILILTTIFSIINYFLPIKPTIIKIIIPILSILVSSIILGKNTKELAYLEGIKFSIIYLIFLTILKFILKTPFNYKVIIMYLSLIITSIIGSTIGINTKKHWLNSVFLLTLNKVLFFKTKATYCIW